MRYLVFIGGTAGFAVLVVLLNRADFSVLFHLWVLAGWPLLGLVAYRALYFLLYAFAWRQLLAPYDHNGRANLGFLWWVSSVREAIDRLLPVASVGGGVVGVRLLTWRGLDAVPVGAAVIVEVILTLIVSYVYAALGIALMLDTSSIGHAVRHVWLAIVCTLPVPISCFLLLRYGAVFVRLQRLVGSMIGVGLKDHAAQLDQELRYLSGLSRALCKAGTFQLTALMSAAFEIWFSLRLFGHPIDLKTAFVLESTTQAVRHLAFFIPGGLGAQEAGLILFAGLYGVNAEMALGVSLVKRLREVLCGLPAIITWQWAEARRLRRGLGVAC